MSSEAICLNLNYDLDTDMLIWTVRFLHNDEVKNVASPAADFSLALGLKDKVSKKDWEFFCNQIKNKKINFILPEVIKQ